MKAVLPAFSPSGLGPLLRSALWVPSWIRARTQLEARLCRQFAADGACLTGSGTQALQLAIETVLVASGERERAIALPAYNCFDLVTAVVGAGAQVRFYDVDPVTLTPSAPDLDRVLEAGVEGVVVAPVFGYQPDWDSLRSRAHEMGATLIEDAAQGQGSRWGDRWAGSFGDLSVLSFGRGKGWTAGGGGALLARTSASAPGTASVGRLDPAPALGGVKALTVATAAWALGRPSLFGLVSRIPGLGLGETHYRAPVPIHTLPGASAALALATEAPSQAEATHRRKAAARMSRALADASSLKVCAPVAGSDPGYLRLPALVAGGSGRIDGVRWSRLQTLGVRAGYPRVLVELDAVRPLLLDVDRSFPGAERLVSELVTLPTHSLAPYPDPAELDRLCS